MNNDEFYDIEAFNDANASHDESMIEGFDETTMETMELDDVLFESFKQKITKEIEEDNIGIDDAPEITLEQAVGDYNGGVEYAFDYLYSYYEPILKRWGKRYNDEELGIELLHIVLLNAAKAFDATAGAKFNTYFWACAHNYVNVYRKRNDAQKRQHYKNMISLQQKLNYNSDSSETELEKTIEDTNDLDEKNKEELKLAVKSLNGLKKNELYILLKVIDDYKLEEIGNELGVTAAAICMTLKRLGGKKKICGKLKEILYNYQ